MGIAALVLWVLTALGGFYMLAKWVAGGGAKRPSSTKLPPAVIFGHFALAAAGLVLWIIYLFVDRRAIGWVAFGVLVPVALLGLAMFVRWIPTYRNSRAPAGVGGGPERASDAGPPERAFPVLVVGGHGVLAVATVVLVLLTDLGIGTMR